MSTMTTDQLAVANQTMTRAEAVAAGLFVAEWSFLDEFVRGYGRTRVEAVVEVMRQRDEYGVLSVTGPDGDLS